MAAVSAALWTPSGLWFDGFPQIWALQPLPLSRCPVAGQGGVHGLEETLETREITYPSEECTMNDDNAPQGLSATTGVLDRAATTVDEARLDVTRLSQALGAQIQGIGGRWSGEGARAFTQLHVAWQDKQRRIVAALDEFSASLTQTERDNRTTDTLRSDSATALINRLG